MKTYLGDGVYAELGNDSIRLSTTRLEKERGDYTREVEHYIYLEPSVLDSLIKFAKKQQDVRRLRDVIFEEQPEEQEDDTKLHER